MSLSLPNMAKADQHSRTELKALCSEFSSELDQYVRTRYRYKTSGVRQGFSNTIDISRVPISLYLRFRPLASWPTDSIVIAKIEFDKQRRGHGSALLRFLVEVAPRYGIKSVGIEQTHDGDDIQGFVRKFGFSPYRDGRNWLVSIEVLEARLNSCSQKY